MNSSRYNKNQLLYLCSLIGSNPAEVKSIKENIDSYYYEKVEEKIDKVTGAPKLYKDGTAKKRVIRPSCKRLKGIQAAIKNNILAPIPLPKNVLGGVKKMSNIQNAKIHQGNKYQFTTDLSDFFPTVTSQAVYKMFLSQNYSQHFAHWLTVLTTWKGNLPQGAPTSTHVANLVFLPVDYVLIDLCTKHNIKYTRYIDDLTFSLPQDFRDIIPDILQTVLHAGFKINYRKTVYDGEQTITGIKVHNNFIDAPEKLKQKAVLEKLSPEGPQHTAAYVERIQATNKKK